MKKIDQERYDKIIEVVKFIDLEKNKTNVISKIESKFNLTAEEINLLFLNWNAINAKDFIQFLAYNGSLKSLNFEQYELFKNSENIDKNSRISEIKFNLINANFETLNTPIYYSFHNHKFGKLCIASSEIGLCKISYFDVESTEILAIENQYKGMILEYKNIKFHEEILALIDQKDIDKNEINIHVYATDFQYKVWNTLLKIPFGIVKSYQDIAQEIGKKESSRAVGTAVAKNPVAYIIPCHRVVQANGNTGEFRWDKYRKKAMLAYEFCTSKL